MSHRCVAGIWSSAPCHPRCRQPDGSGRRSVRSLHTVPPHPSRRVRWSPPSQYRTHSAHRRRAPKGEPAPVMMAADGVQDGRILPVRLDEALEISDSSREVWPLRWHCHAPARARCVSNSGQWRPARTFGSPPQIPRAITQCSSGTMATGYPFSRSDTAFWIFRP